MCVIERIKLNLLEGNGKHFGVWPDRRERVWKDSAWPRAAEASCL